MAVNYDDLTTLYDSPSVTYDGDVVFVQDEFVGGSVVSSRRRKRRDPQLDERVSKRCDDAEAIALAILLMW